MALFIITVLLIGLIPAAIARSKGRSFFLWYLYGCALFIVALPHVLLIGKTDELKRHELKLARGNVSEAEELEKFAKLKDQGILSEAEFAAKKRELLGGGLPAPYTGPY